ncbi:MAG TPA: response regulator [Syntrophales bacterium]|nr:response regulator [Syntrophales bacterium]HLE17670.1 response regulator [Syntrophales bacterium]
MGGIRVLDEALHRKPGLKVVMISAYGNCAVKSRAKELGACEFLDKPFNVKRLIKVVSRALNKKNKIGLPG